jgi:tetratricopeptide (TPR) repeat protein
MMKKTLHMPTSWLTLAAASLLLSLPVPSHAQREPGSALPETAAPVPVPATTPAQNSVVGSEPVTTPAPDHAQAYYHAALAGMYEDEAASEGRPEEITQAIEEYKLALNADPDSPELNNSLADIYFRSGNTRQAESTARNLLKTAPDNVAAHKLLGRIYLRQLGEGQNAAAQTAASAAILDQAIAEYERIITLQAKDVEDRMVLGQLYSMKHDAAKAEAEFKAAQAIEPDSEDVVLNLARLYAESGDLAQAIKVLEAVPEPQRTPKMEFTLGAAYDQQKDTKKAIAAYKRAEDLEPGDPQTIDALGQALLADNQLDDALKQYKQLAEADPESNEPLIHISEIERRQGHYEDALATIQKARKIDPNSMEAGYNEGLLFDVLGRFDDSIKTYQAMVDLTTHANGAYTEEEKNNRSIFLERLGAVYLEANKTADAIATFQKMIDLGGEPATRGYQGQVDTYRGAKEYDKAIEVSKKAVAADPKNRDLKLMLAGELADHGQVEEALAMDNALLTNTPQDRSVFLAIAQINIRLRRWKEAEDAFNKADPLSTKKEDHIYMLFLRGELADREKHPDQAEQFFKQVLDLDPANAMSLNYLGYMLADKGERLPEALKYIRKAVDLEPMNGAYLDSLGWVYFKMGEYELAEDNLRSAVDRDQTDPTVHEHLGDLYEKTGRIRLAAAQWERSLAEFAKSSPADYEAADVAKVQKKLDSARVKLAKQIDPEATPKPE